MTTAAAFDVTPFITEQGTDLTGPWWYLRFPSGAAMNLRAAHTPPCTFHAEIEEAPGAEMTTVDGLATADVWAHAARLAALPATVQLDEDGYPTADYLAAVHAALLARGVAATDPHREEPWDLTIDVPCTGDYADAGQVLLCWRAEEDDPTRGEGWYLLAYPPESNDPYSLHSLRIAHHATPDVVADEVAAYLLDEAPADAQATPTGSDGDDQGDEPDTMTVRVADRRHSPVGHATIRTVTISARCPECGGRRGEPYEYVFRDDDQWLRTDRWENPCGHVDMYDAVLAEAGA